MELSLDTVRAIAELAKLDLTEDEITLYAGQLSNILGYFDHLSQLDTSHIDPLVGVLPLTTVMREDVMKAALSPEIALSNAPSAQDQQFRVSAVLDE
ncbi:MAG: Asp-tRNA(Asn)/Glu-tRNA(Gln) amidotransferase subunit GatC [bacterium]|nr:Asp-tRNA(Asn)/Glu-tRNA(Gln) amidotransferase subunit GatC [bacterium]HRF95416.1 Asp-tRNA(Asn)/Glu-tRNA(Gln) amidotransferase subunit GatC [Aggregatilineales bacterium]